MMKRLLMIFMAMMIVMPAAAQTETWQAEVILRTEANLFAILAPDGTKYAEANRDSICIFLIDGTEQGCTNERVIRLVDLNSIAWSYDSQYLAFTEDFLRLFYEPDIWVLDTDSITLTNVTDDGVDRVSLSDLSAGSGLQDIAPQWLPDGRLLFLRYTQVDGQPIGVFHTMQPDGSDLTPLDIEVEPGYTAYRVSTGSQTDLFLFNIYLPPSTPAVLYMANPETGERTAIFDTSSNPRNTPIEMELNANGTHVLIVTEQWLLDPARDVEEQWLGILNTDSLQETWQMIDDTIFVRAMAWSPDGQRLAYIAYDRDDPSRDGLYISDTPGEPGTQVLQGNFQSPMRFEPIFNWVEGGIIALYSSDEGKLIIVRVTQS